MRTETINNVVQTFYKNELDKQSPHAQNLVAQFVRKVTEIFSQFQTKGTAEFLEDSSTLEFELTHKFVEGVIAKDRDPIKLKFAMKEVGSGPMLDRLTVRCYTLRSEKVSPVQKSAG